ncbi:hypothetical protein [Brotaphodocola sp.]|uniref:hypothetical protein n=1 Tax=Brotaphodocola sp. TaxID=3073577 RepID=UPI003D7E67F9
MLEIIFDSTHKSDYQLYYGNFDRLLVELRELKIKINVKDLCDILNRINNQGITDVSLEMLFYIRYGKTLPITLMSTAEKMFLISYIAKVGKVDLAIYDYPEELSPRASKLFVEMFSESNIAVCLKHDCLAFYALWKGELLCS